MEYQISTRQFSGPIELLWEMIDERKLEITELNLAEVTADFLEYLKGLEETHPRLLADFIVVASRLLLIKSKALLPNLELTPEEEAGIKNLESQLRFYQSFKPAIAHLKKTWEEQKGFSVSRQLMAGRPIVFYPSASVTSENLLASINSIFELLRKFEIETGTIKSSLISLEEKIREIIARMENLQGNSLQFQNLTKEKGRSETIVLFLAILQLLHTQLIKADQKSKFSDIIIERI